MLLRKLKDSVIEILYFFIIKLNKFPKVEDIDVTIGKIINERKSISRYGDGEITILKKGGVGFQCFNDKLSKRLAEILNSNADNILIGIPNIFTYDDLKDTVDITKKFWKTELILKLKNYKMINPKKVYYNAFITRPYIRYKDKSNAELIFDKLKDIWKDRDIVIIEGEQTRLGCGNDLFDNVKSIKRIECPNKDAFEKYNDILEKSLKLGKETLILIALGPTATVLAYDLAQNGYQALDIGHIDIEYEWFKRGVSEKVKIEGKFTNEIYDGHEVDSVKDEIYENQIIERII